MEGVSHLELVIRSEAEIEGQYRSGQHDISKSRVEEYRAFRPGVKAKTHPEEWVWVKAKRGAIGIPFPDGSEYCFAPGVAFPLFKEYLGHTHNSMFGEVREI